MMRFLFIGGHIILRWFVEAHVGFRLLVRMWGTTYSGWSWLGCGLIFMFGLSGVMFTSVLVAGQSGVLNEAEFSVEWTSNLSFLGSIRREIYSVDINSDGLQEILVPFVKRIAVLDPVNGSLIGVLPPLEDEDISLAGSGIAIGDVDGDGSLEIVAPTRWDKVISVLDLAGRIKWSIPVEENPRLLPVLEDLDGDGILDILLNAEDLSAFRFNGTGFELYADFGEVDMATVVDFDSDGVPEVLAHRCSSSIDSIVCMDSKGRVLWSYIVQGSVQNPIIVGDMNGDGVYEVIVYTWGDFVYCLDSRGDKIWSSYVDYPKSVSVADVDQNGVLDVVVLGRDKTYLIDGWMGSHIWTRPRASGVGEPGSTPPLIADLDGDSRLEIIVSDGYQGACEILDENGSLEYTLPPELWKYTRVSVGDFDSDGVIEIVAVDPSQWPLLCLSLGGQYNKSLTPWPLPHLNPWNNALIETTQIPVPGPGESPKIERLPHFSLFPNARSPPLRLEDFVTDPDTPIDSIDLFLADGEMFLEIDYEEGLMYFVAPNRTGQVTDRIVARDPEGHRTEQGLDVVVNPDFLGVVEEEWNCSSLSNGQLFFSPSGIPKVADVDLDGYREILLACNSHGAEGTGGVEGVAGVACLSHQGSVKWIFADLSLAPSEAVSRAWITLDDLDADGLVETLYVSNTGCLYCLSSSGEERWRYMLDGSAPGPPQTAVYSYNQTTSHRQVFLTVNPLDQENPVPLSRVVCLNWTGEVIWEVDLDQEVTGYPVTWGPDEEILLVPNARGIVALNLYDGTVSGEYVDYQAEDSVYLFALPCDSFDHPGYDVVCGRSDGLIRTLNWKLMPIHHLSLPVNLGGGFALGDMDLDKGFELIVADDEESSVYCVNLEPRNDPRAIKWVLRMPSSPVIEGYRSSGFFPVIGDLDADQEVEIVIPGQVSLILGEEGELKSTLGEGIQGVWCGDLDRDMVVEVLASATGWVASFTMKGEYDWPVTRIPWSSAMRTPANKPGIPEAPPRVPPGWSKPMLDRAVFWNLPEITVVDDDWINYDVLTIGPQEVMVVYKSESTGYIMSITSLDGGINWSAPTRFVKNCQDNLTGKQIERFSAYHAQGRDGNNLLSIVHYDPGGYTVLQGERVFRIGRLYYLTSDDGGSSWSRTKNLSHLLRRNLFIGDFPRICGLQGGRDSRGVIWIAMIVCGGTAHNSRRQTFLTHSNDGGETWEPFTALYKYDELAGVPFSDSWGWLWVAAWTGNVRYQSGSVYLELSKEVGTFIPETTYVPGYQWFYTTPIMREDSSGNLWLLLRMGSVDPPPGIERPSVLYLSTDRGETWRYYANLGKYHKFETQDKNTLLLFIVSGSSISVKRHVHQINENGPITPILIGVLVLIIIMGPHARTLERNPMIPSRYRGHDCVPITVDIAGTIGSSFRFFS